MQIVNKVPEGSHVADEVWCRQGSGGGFRMADEVRRVPAQIASKVCGKFYGITAESRQTSGLFWCSWPMKFRMVPVQIADRVAEVSGAHSRQSSGFGYKNLRSSKLLEITHEFIQLA